MNFKSNGTQGILTNLSGDRTEVQYWDVELSKTESRHSGVLNSRSKANLKIICNDQTQLISKLLGSSMFHIFVYNQTYKPPIRVVYNRRTRLWEFCSSALIINIKFTFFIIYCIESINMCKCW